MPTCAHATVNATVVVVRGEASLAVTSKDISEAQPFTVWEGPRRLKDCAEESFLWDMFHVMGNHDEVVESIFMQAGWEIVEQDGVLNPQVDDETVAGLELDDVDDLNAAVMAIREGHTIAKVPDYIGCEYYRMLVVRRRVNG